ncbi:molybdate ABC transporter substrate-binding protein [Salinicoccus kekensis]|uniref:Molybdate transport system substrate-binding protein n=1 Tax=Salinicoccus kekensis TaxID=714307 RepID=A0A285UP01_9STAP|nr:molybdate ABC transporter substrate-binding protein [Salinicoccus kekensis]SOC43614.1 molybdate transport system substrate-binding protein [Salinicoccus kekensis]
MKLMDGLKFLMLFLAVFVVAACGNGEVDENITDDEDSTDTTLESPEEAPEDTATDVEGTITVSAAASLVDALGEITTLFNEEYPEVTVDYNFGGSGALMQQIIQGAPVDLFFSANVDHFQEVMEEGYIDEEDSVDLLTNELVLIVPTGSDSVTSFDDLENADQIAIGNPESVPAGEYSVEAFENMDIMEEIESKLIYAEDVRQVLNYVETGNADAGMVYHTDTIMSDGADVVDAAPEDAHSPIVYPLGMMNDTDDEAAQLAFFEFMQSEEAGEVFNEYGFIIQ